MGIFDKLFGTKNNKNEQAPVSEKLNQRKVPETWGGGFFIPVTEVYKAPMGPHIEMDSFSGSPVLSKNYVYVQPHLSELIAKGTNFPESALQANNKQYTLASGKIESNRMVMEDKDGIKAVMCFRSISSLINCCGDSCWISFGTIEDVIEKCEAEYVLIDMGLPQQTAVPMKVIKEAFS